MAKSQLRVLARLRTDLGPPMSLGELRALGAAPPFVLLSGVTRAWLDVKLEHLQPLPEWLVVRALEHDRSS